MALSRRLLPQQAAIGLRDLFTRRAVRRAVTQPLSQLESHPIPPSTATTNDGRPRCAIYARYSSDNQKQSSIGDQIHRCRDEAAGKDWVVLENFIFTDEEKTGTTIHGRTGLSQVIDAAKAKPKPFDYILVDDTSRLGRNKGDTFKNVDIIRFYKVRLYFVEDGLDSGQSWFDAAFHQKAHRDEAYSKTLSYKVKGARRRRFLEGYNPGGYCYGYRNVPDEDPTRKGDYGRPHVKGIYQVIHEKEAAVVERIFRAYSSGMTLLQIATMLNLEGVPSPQARNRKGKAAGARAP